MDDDECYKAWFARDEGEGPSCRVCSYCGAPVGKSRGRFCSSPCADAGRRKDSLILMWDAHRRRKKDVLLISELNEFQGQTGVAYTEEARLLQLAVRKDAAAEHHGSGRRPSHGLATCTAVDRLVIKLQKGLDSYGRDFSWSYARRIAVFAGLIEGDKAAGERLRATLNRHTEKEVAWAEATRRLGEETRGKTRSRRRPARTKGRRLSQQSRTKRRRQ